MEAIIENGILQAPEFEFSIKLEGHTWQIIREFIIETAEIYKEEFREQQELLKKVEKKRFRLSKTDKKTGV